MRILIIHNYYQSRGGEDESVDQEVALLRKTGHEVYLYSRHNNEIKNFSLPRRCLLFLEPTWSQRTFREIKRVIKKFVPDVVHVHNFFPLISPSVFYACSEMRVPVIHTLRNYRLLCHTGLLFRKNRICEECVDCSIWHGLIHRCYHNSYLQTASISLMLSAHRLMHTWQNKVSLFVASTEFSRAKFVKAGIPEKRIIVRPNYLLNDPGIGAEKRDGALFIGRLSHEKGLELLLNAWKELPDLPLTITGDGPLRPWMENFISRNNIKQIHIAGFLPADSVFKKLKKALFLVMPSTCYETFGRVIIEAYACGTPVLASRLGAMAELVQEDKTGLLFKAGGAADLAKQVRHALNNIDNLYKWGRAGRNLFEEKYSGEIAYQRLMDIYTHAASVAKTS